MEQKRIPKRELLECPEYVTVLNQWPDVKRNPAIASSWRTNLSAAVKACREKEAEEASIMFVDDCNPADIRGLTSILGELTLMNSGRGEVEDDIQNSKRRRKGGKMVGGGYAELVAQLNNLVTWLGVHAGHISDCAKWFLQKIWAASITAARAAAEVAAAGAEVTGITDMLELLGILTEFGEAAINDIHNTILMDPDTTTRHAVKSVFDFAVEALKLLIAQPASATVGPYVEAISQYINGVMTANMSAITTASEGMIATPADFQGWLGRTSITTKLYWMVVSLNLVKSLPALAGAALTGASIAVRTSVYFAPIVYHITNSNIFTAALLMHAGFYQLTDTTQAKVLNAYYAFDRRIAETIHPPEDTLAAFDTHIKATLQGDELIHFRNTVNLQQQIAKISGEIGKTKRLIDHKTEEQVLADQIKVAIARAAELQADLDSRMTPPGSVFPNAAGSGAGAAPPTNVIGLGGNRSTRKRGSNKKGGAKSKCSPKSTRKSGRKQSARKRH